MLIIVLPQTLVELGLQVKEAVVFLDRQQGGRGNLTAMGINVVSVLTMTQVCCRITLC